MVATFATLYKAQNQENRETPFSECKNSLFHPCRETHLNVHFRAFNSSSIYPKNLFGLFLTSKGYFKFSGYLEKPQKMHWKTRENWSFSGFFFDFRVILTSGGYLLKIT